jgi:hypothetical protein
VVGLVVVTAWLKAEGAPAVKPTGDPVAVADEWLALIATQYLVPGVSPVMLTVTVW